MQPELYLTPIDTTSITSGFLFSSPWCLFFFVYLGFYVAFNTVQVISRRVVGRAEETSTYSSLGLCTVNCQPTSSNYQLSHLRLCRASIPGLRGGRRQFYHSVTVAPRMVFKTATLVYKFLHTGFTVYFAPYLSSYSN